MTLRDKLKALTAPSREVDAEIAEAFGVPNAHFTATLDASVELVEREMPGKKWSVVRYENNDTTPLIGDNADCAWDCAWGDHQLPAVALLLALVDAKEIE